MLAMTESHMTVATSPEAQRSSSTISSTILARFPVLRLGHGNRWCRYRQVIPLCTRPQATPGWSRCQAVEPSSQAVVAFPGSRSAAQRLPQVQDVPSGSLVPKECCLRAPGAIVGCQYCIRLLADQEATLLSSQRGMSVEASRTGLARTSQECRRSRYGWGLGTPQSNLLRPAGGDPSTKKGGQAAHHPRKGEYSTGEQKRPRTVHLSVRKRPQTLIFAQDTNRWAR